MLCERGIFIKVLVVSFKTANIVFSPVVLLMLLLMFSSL